MISYDQSVPHQPESWPRHAKSVIIDLGRNPKTNNTTLLGAWCVDLLLPATDESRSSIANTVYVCAHDKFSCRYGTRMAYQALDVVLVTDFSTFVHSILHFALVRFASRRPTFDGPSQFRALRKMHVTLVISTHSGCCQTSLATKSALPCLGKRTLLSKYHYFY